MTGEYVLLDKTDAVQPSTSSGGESEPSEDEDKPPSQSPLNSSEDSLALDKIFGFVDYDEVSVPYWDLFFSRFKLSLVFLFCL